ncbi:metal-sulfur cluster assembly factor [Patescibacteria group bacterium AH-259-L07]|nr:metal-sulfur cluster assembly factor [Patescibacteria group bacterium AH-259-L07]
MAKVTKQQVITALKKCIDPELRIDIWSLGLIYDIRVKTKDKQTTVDITATLTTPACALGPHIMQDITSNVEKIKGVKKCNVVITFDPRWTPEKMTEEAKAQLGFL